MLLEIKGRDEDDSANQEFVWEDMENYRGQREHFNTILLFIIFIGLLSQK
jgi:hypothetical protein